MKHLTLLQTPSIPIPAAVSEFLQYGILGIVASILTYFAWSQWQRLESKNKELEKKVDKLQEDMKNLLTEDRERMVQLIQDNTKAMQELSRIVLEYIINRE